MEEEKIFSIRFNQILLEEMKRSFELKPLYLDPEFALKFPDKEDSKVYIKNEYYGCAKTSGIRMGEMDFGGAMMVHFGSVKPAQDYDFPILGFTFVASNKLIIVVLDLHPVSKDDAYMNQYLAPLREVSAKYQWIPRSGGRTEPHDWAKVYDSGYSLYRWCDPKYLPDIEQAFRDYIGVFCECLKKAEPVTDQEMLKRREQYLEQYRYDYTTYDPGSAPLKHHFGEDWGERYLRDFLFAE